MPRLTRRIDGESAAVARDELNNRLFFRVFQTANLYEAQVTRELTCSAVQGAVLGALSRDVEQGMSFSALYTYLAVSRQNLDAVLKRLEQAAYVVDCIRGFVETNQSADQRGTGLAAVAAT